MQVSPQSLSRLLELLTALSSAAANLEDIPVAPVPPKSGASKHPRRRRAGSVAQEFGASEGGSMDESLGAEDFFMLETILRTMQGAQGGDSGVLGAVSHALAHTLRGGDTGDILAAHFPGGGSGSGSSGDDGPGTALAGSAVLASASNIQSSLDDEDMLASLVLPGSPGSHASSRGGHESYVVGSAGLLQLCKYEAAHTMRAWVCACCSRAFSTMDETQFFSVASLGAGGPLTAGHAMQFDADDGSGSDTDDADAFFDCQRGTASVLDVRATYKAPNAGQGPHTTAGDAVTSSWYVQALSVSAFGCVSCVDRALCCVPRMSVRNLRAKTKPTMRVKVHLMSASVTMFRSAPPQSGQPSPASPRSRGGSVDMPTLLPVQSHCLELHVQDALVVLVQSQASTTVDTSFKAAAFVERTFPPGCPQHGVETPRISIVPRGRTAQALRINVCIMAASALAAMSAPGGFAGAGIGGGAGGTPTGLSPGSVPPPTLVKVDVEPTSVCWDIDGLLGWSAAYSSVGGGAAAAGVGAVAKAVAKATAEAVLASGDGASAAAAAGARSDRPPRHGAHPHRRRRRRHHHSDGHSRHSVLPPPSVASRGAASVATHKSNVQGVKAALRELVAGMDGDSKHAGDTDGDSCTYRLSLNVAYCEVALGFPGT